MGSLEMTLDDIISLSKMKNRSNNNRKSNYRPKKRFVYRDLDEPEERRMMPSLMSHRIGGNPNTVVRLNLSNLAPTVSSADLVELFEQYNIESATVHFNETGISVGTGDIYLRKEDAVNAMKDYEGVALDNKILRMNLIDTNRCMESNINQNNHYHQKKKGFVNKSSYKNKNSSPMQHRGKKQLKSMEVLDAELDAYMKKSG